NDSQAPQRRGIRALLVLLLVPQVQLVLLLRLSDGPAFGLSDLPVQRSDDLDCFFCRFAIRAVRSPDPSTLAHSHLFRNPQHAVVNRVGHVPSHHRWWMRRHTTESQRFNRLLGALMNNTRPAQRASVL